MSTSDFYLSKNHGSSDGIEIKIPNQYAKRLKNFQIEGIRFLHSRKGGGAILNDETGLGKTVQTILYISAIQFAFPTKKTIIICDEDSYDHWLFHAEKWTQLSKSIYKDSYTNDISISSLDDARSIQNQKWGIVVIDDLKENDVVKNLINIKCEFKIWLTNDNLLINLKKLHKILNWIAPGNIMNLKSFEMKYSNFENNLIESWKMQQLLDVYCKPWLLRRTKNMIADELPLDSVESYMSSFRQWKKQSHHRHQSKDSDVIIIEKKHDIMEIEDSTTDDSQTCSPVIPIPTIRMRNNAEELKRKGTKDITGLKIKRNRNKQNEIEDGERVHQTSNGNDSIKEKSDEISEENFYSKTNINVLSDSCSIGQGRIPFKLLDDILFGCHK